MRCCRVAMRATKPCPSRVLASSLSAGSADAHDDRVGFAGSFGDQPILFFDCGARRRIAIQATKDINWNSPVRSLRTILVEHVEQREFWLGRRFSTGTAVFRMSCQVIPEKRNRDEPRKKPLARRRGCLRGSVHSNSLCVAGRNCLAGKSGCDADRRNAYD